MHCANHALAAALTVGSLSSIASAASGPPAVFGEESDEAPQSRPAGHHCWYRGIAKSGPNHWHGSGWYWCGQRLRESDRREPPAERREPPSERREAPHVTERHDRHPAERHQAERHQAERHRSAHPPRHWRAPASPQTPGHYPGYYYPSQQYYYPR